MNKYDTAIAELRTRAGRTLKTAIEAMEQQAERENMRCENCRHIRFNDNFHWCGCASGLVGNRELTDFCSYFKPRENENG